MKRTGKFWKKLTQLCALVMAGSLIFAVGCGDGDDKGETEKHEAFIEELGGCSDTYKGEVSEYTYETKELAAKAFVEEQVVGDNDVTIVKTESKGELSSTQIEALNIPEAEKTDIVSVEEVEVEYALESSTYMSKTQSASPNKIVKVYIIKYPNTFKYYSPAPVTGETVTRSYYDSIFDTEKYQNCTMTSTFEMSTEMTTLTLQGKKTTTNSQKTTIFAQYSEDKIFQQRTIETTENGETTTSSESIYIEKVDNNILCYSNKTGAWTLAGYIGFSDLEDLMPFADAYLDYTYFTKTEFGCEIGQDNMMRYIRETFENDSLVMEYLEQMDISAITKYYVAEGVLSGMRQDMTLSLSEGIASAKVISKVETICKDYGTTVVERPAME